MRFRAINLLVLVLAIALVTGCSWGRGSSENQQSDAKKQEKPAQEKPTPAAKPAPNPDALPEVVAKVNGQDIKKQELLTYLREVESRLVQSGQAPPPNRGELVKPALDELVGLKLLFQEGKSKGLTPSKEEVEKKVTETKKRFPDEKAFQQALQSEGMTLEKLQEDIQFTMTIEKYVDTNIIPKVEVKDEDAKAFYSSNKDSMKEPEQVRASHILIKLDPNADAKAKEQARAKAEGVLKKAKANENFAALAKANSDDPGSKDQGGELPFFTKGQMVPEFEKAAWGLKPGEISGIVETQFGFHVIKLIERKPERVVPFEEAKEQIKGYLKRKGVSDKIRATMEELRSKGKVTILI